jgi:hypothetical protein
MERSLYGYILASMSEVAGRGWFLDISVTFSLRVLGSVIVVAFEKKDFQETYHYQATFTFSEDGSKQAWQSAVWCSLEEPTEENVERDTDYCRAAMAACADHFERTEEEDEFKVFVRTLLDHYLVFIGNGRERLLPRRRRFVVDPSFNVVGYSQERF